MVDVRQPGQAREQPSKWRGAPAYLSSTPHVVVNLGDLRSFFAASGRYVKFMGYPVLCCRVAWLWLLRCRRYSL
jgi:hypothetical protein